MATPDLEAVSSKEVLIYDGHRSEQPDLRLLHYNDVYHIESVPSFSLSVLDNTELAADPAVESL